MAGAFALLAVLIGGGAIALGLVARRQIRRSGATPDGAVHRRGVAVGRNLVRRGRGWESALLALALALVLQLS